LNNQLFMKKLLLMLTVASVAGLPIGASAQNTDSTAPAPSAPHSTWQTYHQETAPHHYGTSDWQNSNKHYFEVGGAISLGFYAGEFLVGANPYVGYAVAPWLDAGVAINFQYYSLNEQATYGQGTYHNTLLGGGIFARVFPVRFLFFQVQPEYNTIWQNESLDGQSTGSISYSETSILVGGGVKFGAPDSKSWGFAAVLFDVGGSSLSPYNGTGGYVLPIIRIGYNYGF
jgi:hypothetical protein